MSFFVKKKEEANNRFTIKANYHKAYTRGGSKK